MAHLPVDQKTGLAIPVSVPIDDGKISWGQVEITLRNADDLLKSCPVCGKPQQKALWFICGPKVFASQNPQFYEPPMHYMCAQYMLEVAPYMTKLMDPVVIRRRNLGAGKGTTKSSMIDVALMTKNVKIRMTQTGEVTIVPQLPWKNMEFWMDGKRLKRETGYMMARIGAREVLVEGTTQNR